MDIDALMRLAAKALCAGGRMIGPTVLEWDIAGGCQSPAHREMWALPYRDQKLTATRWEVCPIPVRVHSDSGLNPVLEFRDWFPVYQEIKRKWTNGFTVLLKAKCRKCDRCRAERSRLWAARAAYEIQSGLRTWLCTFTLKPDEQVRFAALAAARLSRQGVDFDLLPFGEQLLERHREISKEFTLLFKRLRKDGAEFRYLLVLEAHKSGLPHYHALVHEIAEPIRHATLAATWRFGFARFKLVGLEDKAAWYCAKYLGKSTSARVRSSVRYGQPRS